MKEILVLATLTLPACAIAEAQEGAAAPETQSIEGDMDRGEALWGGCVPCHGTEGVGRQDVGAPAIAGQEDWYIYRQLGKYRRGIRGAHPDDIAGLRMRPMSRMLQTEADVRAITAYVASLPTPSVPTTLEEADASKGQALYATCTACHGADGKGNPALNAPDLTGLNDWYIVAQLEKFKSGVRGTNPADVEGAQMRPMSMTLPDVQAMKDVAAHIKTLK